MRDFASLTPTGRTRRLRSLALQALRRYDLPDARVRLEADSFNTIFRVSSRGVAHLLRVGPAAPVHEPGVALAEHRWTASLAEHGLPVPRVVMARDGSAAVLVSTADVPGPRECALLTWRPGRPLVRPLGAHDVAELAALAAHLHEASATRPERPPGVLDGRRVLQFAIPDLLDRAPDPLRPVLREAAVRAQAGLDALWADADDAPRLIHTDLTPSNVIRSRGRLAPIDFQDLAWGHVQQDLANTLYGIGGGADAGALVPAFRAGYETVRRWPALDDGRLADLVAARRLTVVNVAISQHAPGLADRLAGHADALRAYLRGGGL